MITFDSLTLLCPFDKPANIVPSFTKLIMQAPNQVHAIETCGPWQENLNNKSRWFTHTQHKDECKLVHAMAVPSNDSFLLLLPTLFYGIDSLLAHKVVSHGTSLTTVQPNLMGLAQDCVNESKL